MISKKICMLGAFATGKTSLVEQYVHSIFSEKYLSTVGLRISKKVLNVNEAEVSLVLWDMEGKDDFVDINLSYLRGAMGVFLVADVSRRETIEIALTIRKTTRKLLGESIPNILLLNKCDLPHWEVTAQDIEDLESQKIHVIKTSAKTGESVDFAFLSLTKAML